MPSDKTPDLSIDEWMTANSDLDHKRLHALGVIMQRWNRAERWLFTIFCDVSGYDEPEAWALVYNLGTPQIAERIRSLLKIRNFATEAPLIENALEVFAAREPLQLQLWVRIFCLQSRQRARCWAGPWAFYKLVDDKIVPLICPTCQMFFAGSLKASMLTTPGYFAWGCFRYFSWERA